MDALDKITEAIETVCRVTAGVRDSVLDELIEDARDPNGRAAVAEGAIEYAQLTRTLDAWRSQLRRPDAPVQVLKRR